MHRKTIGLDQLDKVGNVQKDNIRPRTDACGTLYFISDTGDRLFLTLTYSKRSDRYKQSHIHDMPSIPYVAYP